MTIEPELMSWHSRFIAALMVLTGAPNEPPGAFIAEWFDKDSTRVDDRLQNWVGGQPGVLWWAQAIAVIDAARIMADQPIEGSPSIDYENPTEPTPFEADYAAAATFERARVAEATYAAARSREWGKVAQERIAQVAAERVRAEDEIDKLDAKRYRFLEKHWHSHMEGLPLHRWVEKTKLRWGGLSNALDHVMKVGE